MPQLGYYRCTTVQQGALSFIFLIFQYNIENYINKHSRIRLTSALGQLTSSLYQNVTALCNTPIPPPHVVHLCNLKEAYLYVRPNALHKYKGIYYI